MSEIDGASILTIGHSNHVLDVFLALLRQHRVTAVADVRSAPYSRFNPQFNRESLAEALGGEGIRYVYLGNALGVGGCVKARIYGEQRRVRSAVDRCR